MGLPTGLQSRLWRNHTHFHPIPAPAMAALEGQIMTPQKPSFFLLTCVQPRLKVRHAFSRGISRRNESGAIGSGRSNPLLKNPCRVTLAGTFFSVIRAGHERWSIKAAMPYAFEQMAVHWARVVLYPIKISATGLGVCQQWRRSGHLNGLKRRGYNRVRESLESAHNAKATETPGIGAGSLSGVPRKHRPFRRLVNQRPGQVRRMSLLKREPMLTGKNRESKPPERDWLGSRVH